VKRYLQSYDVAAGFLEWWRVGLGSYPFVAYPSRGCEWLLTTELFLGVLFLWCCVSLIGVMLYYGEQSVSRSAVFLSSGKEDRFVFLLTFLP